MITLTYRQDGEKEVIIMTAKERQIWFWQKEVEARLFAWKEYLKNCDSEGAKQAKRQYIEARKTLEELEEKHNEDLA